MANLTYNVHYMFIAIVSTGKTTKSDLMYVHWRFVKQNVTDRSIDNCMYLIAKHAIVCKASKIII